MNVFILSPMITIYLLVLGALTISLIKDVVGQSLAAGLQYWDACASRDFALACLLTICLPDSFWISENGKSKYSLSFHTCNSGGGSLNSKQIVVDRTQARHDSCHTIKTKCIINLAWKTEEKIYKQQVSQVNFG